MTTYEYDTEPIIVFQPRDPRNIRYTVLDTNKTPIAFTKTLEKAKLIAEKYDADYIRPAEYRQLSSYEYSSYQKHRDLIIYEAEDFGYEPFTEYEDDDIYYYIVIDFGNSYAYIRE